MSATGYSGGFLDTTGLGTVETADSLHASLYKTTVPFHVTIVLSRSTIKQILILNQNEVLFIESHIEIIFYVEFVRDDTDLINYRE